MSNLIRKLTHSEIIRNSGKLLSANVAAQAIGLLLYPILSRLYTPDDFGVYNLYLSIGSILILLSTAELQYAIVLPQDDRQAAAVWQSAMTNVLFIVGLCLLMLPFAENITEMFHAQSLAEYMWLLPIYILCMGTWNTLNYWLTRHKRFASVSAFQLSQSACGGATKVGLGYIGIGAPGLLYSTLIAPVSGILSALLTAGKACFRPLLHIDKSECRKAVRTYRNFPIYSLPRAFVNTFGGNMPALLMAPAFGMAEVGYFGMALTLAFRPLSMISGSIYQVLYQRVSERINHKQTIQVYFRQYWQKTTMVVVPVFALLFVILPWCVDWFLGEEWASTATCIRWMLPWLATSILVAPICFLSDVFMQQRKALVYEIAYFLGRLIGLGVGIYMDSFIVAIAGYSLMSALVISAQLLWYQSLIRQYEQKLSSADSSL